jgi:hypothetical protein
VERIVDSGAVKKLPSLLFPAIALLAGLLTLIPPSVIGTGSSALALQSLEHWMRGAPDTFEALHVHWLWIPRVIAFITGDAFAALVIFRVIVVALAVYFFLLTAQRMFDERRAIIGAAMLVLNVTVLYLSHTFDAQLLTLLAATTLLYLFTSPNPQHHKLAAILFGLSLSIGFWPFVLLIAVVTVGLSLHHATYGPRSKQTYILFGLMLVGTASYMLLEIFYFGYAHVWSAMNPKFFPPRGISLIAQGFIIAIVSANILLVTIFRRKAGDIAREFQSAFVILGVFFLTNTFSRDEMLHDVVILVPCLILVALDKFTNAWRLGAIYAIFNLGLFFFLPAFQTSSEVAMPDLKRTQSNDDVSFSYYGTADLFSYAQLHEEKAGEEEAMELLSHARLDSTLVLINPSTDTWFDAATLGAASIGDDAFPQKNFGWFYGTPINLVRKNGLIDTAYIRPPASMPYISGLFEKEFARKFIDPALPPNTPLKESQIFQFIDCRGNEAARKALIDQLISVSYQGFHHH